MQTHDAAASPGRTQRRTFIDQAALKGAVDFAGLAFGVSPDDPASSRPSAGEPRLRIGLAVTLNGGPLAQGLARFRAAHPDLPITLQDGDARQGMGRLQRGLIDVLFAPAVRPPSGIERKPLWREPLYAMLAQDDPLAAGEVLREEQLGGAVVLMSRAQDFEPCGAWLQDLADQGRVTLSRHPVERETLANLVAAGGGVAFTSRSYLGAHHAGITYRQLDGFDVGVSAFWRPSATPERLGALIEAVGETADPAARWSTGR